MDDNGVLWGYDEIGRWLVKAGGGQSISRVTILKWAENDGFPLRKKGYSVFAKVDEILDWLVKFPLKY